MGVHLLCNSASCAAFCNPPCLPLARRHCSIPGYKTRYDNVNLVTIREVGPPAVRQRQRRRTLRAARAEGRRAPGDCSRGGHGIARAPRRPSQPPWQHCFAASKVLIDRLTDRFIYCLLLACCRTPRASTLGWSTRWCPAWWSRSRCARGSRGRGRAASAVQEAWQSGAEAAGACRRPARLPVSRIITCVAWTDRARCQRVSVAVALPSSVLSLADHHPRGVYPRGRVCV